MFLTKFYSFIACNCDAAGSQYSACDDYGRCSCITGYAGGKCGVCACGLYKKLAGLPKASKQSGFNKQWHIVL